MSDIVERTQRFRSAIAAFIDSERRDKEKPNDRSDRYEYQAWLRNAAASAKEIQLATFPIKATFPDIHINRASSLFIQGKDLTQHQEIGTHLVKHDVWDATGNAAKLGVFKFLSKVVVDGQPLVHWLLIDDPDLLAALSDDEAQAKELARSFKMVDRRDSEPASESRAKQVYWLIGDNPEDDGGYHLLQPLFSSSLAHEVHGDIQTTRFGEENKAIRAAFRDHKPHEGVYREYRGLAYRKLGGTKPQNISQLNSERGGMNYLLASLPPTWRVRKNLRLQRRRTAFDVFPHYDEVRKQVRALARLLKEHEDAKSTLPIRQAREGLEQDLAASLAAFGLEAQQSYPPGWTRESDCELPLCECLWLDPERAGLAPRPAHQEEDVAFRVAYIQGDWADEVAGRFANWLNGELRNAGLTAVGDIEAQHWARQALVDVAWPVPLQRRAGGAA